MTRLGVSGLQGHPIIVVLVFNAPLTARVIWRQGYGLKSLLTRIKPATPGLQS